MSQRTTSVLVLAVWAVMTAADLLFVARYAFTTPYADELAWVPVASGAEPVTLDWLLAPQNQHRMALSKLLYLGLGWATGFDFRAACAASVLLLSALALAALLTLRQHRGHLTPSDVVVPVALLHLGHYLNLMWGIQIAYVLPVVFACLALLLIYRTRGEVSLSRGIGLFACLALMACSGGPGICLLPPLAFWLGYAGMRRFGGEQPSRLAGTSIVALALLLLSAVPLYFYSMTAAQRGVGFATASPAIIGNGAVQFLSISIGRFGRDTWPVSGVLILGTIVAALAQLGRTWLREPQQRARTAGLAMFLVAIVSLALSIAISRAHLEPEACRHTRYIVLATPLVLGLYLVAVLHGATIRRAWLSPAFGLAMAALAIVYAPNGVKHAAKMQQRVLHLESLVHQGQPLQSVATQCATEMQAPPQQLQLLLEQMQAARIGPYRR